MSTLSHKVSIGEEVEFECVEGDTVLRAALRAGLNFPYECNSGGCGSCKFELVSGQSQNLWPEAPGLSERDISKGRQLACQCVPIEDCRIKVRIKPSDTVELLPVRAQATLLKVQPITDDMAEFCFKSESPANFKPGQFALLDIPGVVGSRGYSMSNLANNDNEWHFIIKKRPDGKGSSYLFDECKVGDKVGLDGPFGLAYLKPHSTRDIVCVAGGSGISPAMGILKAASLDRVLKDRKIYLFYGGRAPKDICPPDLIQADKGLRERIINFNAVSDVDAAKAAAWDGEVGYVHELLAKKLVESITEHDFYICGPPPMTDALSRMLVTEHRVPFEQIHYDRFY
jgi:toluene monooxygenase electron transfer component